MEPYYYTELPGIIPTPFPGDEKTAGPPIIMNPRVLIEHSIFDFRIVAYRADLTDGRRVFRTEARFTERMLKDANGFFLSFLNNKYYWTLTNPVTANDTFVHEWGPL